MTARGRLEQARLRSGPVLSSFRPPLLLPELPPQTCSRSAPKGLGRGRGAGRPAPGMQRLSSGLSAASSATPGPCRPAETTFPSHPAAPPPTQNKHSRCQRATRAHNEKQVSPRDLSAQAVQQLGVTAWGQGRGVGMAVLTRLAGGPSTGCSSPLPPTLVTGGCD